MCDNVQLVVVGGQWGDCEIVSALKYVALHVLG